MPRIFVVFLAPLALLAVAACTTPFRADVARFQQMPAPQGQSFYIQPVDSEKAAGLEFATYANLVAAELSQYGYAPARSSEDASLVVTMEYSVDNGRERVITSPGLHRGYWGYSPFYHRLRWRSPYYYGWYDPFFDDTFGGPRIRSYTVYTSELNLRIDQTNTGESVFEGRARARSRSDALTELVPNLIEAMFTGFPGNSGEEVRITVMPRDDG
jgi:hypothetical protein